MPPKRELLTGTLDLLVLKALQLGDVHGWGIMDRIRQTSGDVLQVNQGSLYPALYRLKRQGLIGSYWAVTENNRRARYYAVTARGRERLAAERQEWRRLSEAVNRVLSTTTV
jgi:PadR family transcriptional regulator, regulatory protein PadR